jgi:hypothetical protein
MRLRIASSKVPYTTAAIPCCWPRSEDGIAVHSLIIGPGLVPGQPTKKLQVCVQALEPCPGYCAGSPGDLLGPWPVSATSASGVDLRLKTSLYLETAG